MSISVDQCIYGTGQEVTLAFMDPACAPTKSVDGTWDSSHALDQCGTRAFAEDDMIKFENSLTVQSRAGDLIMHSDPDLTFTCQFAATIDGVSTGLSVLGEDTHTSQGANSEGAFEFLLEFVAPDENGDFGIAPNDTMVVGERVYFDVVNVKPLDGLSFFVQVRVTNVWDISEFGRTRLSTHFLALKWLPKLEVAYNCHHQVPCDMLAPESNSQGCQTSTK